MTRLTVAACLSVLTAIALFGCGGDSGGGGAYGNKGGTTASTTSTSSVKETTTERPKPGYWGVAFGASSADLGLIIFDLSGHTLYTFSKDSGKTSTCYGACAKAWPPALSEGKVRAGGNAIPAKVGTTKRKDGTIQITYAGHPLYRYSRDRSSEIKGNGAQAFGGTWYAIRPDGEKP